MSGKPWTKEELEIIQAKYEGCKDLSELNLDRSEKSIYQKANQLGLKRKINSGQENIKNCQFKKGHIPFNKGTKGFMKPNKTSFKKGDIPVNVKYNGGPYFYSRKDRNEMCWYIQPSGSGKRRSYAKYLWELHNGPIPRGHIIKNINISETIPPTIDDLRLLTRGENMDANSIHRYSPEMKKAFKLIKKIDKLTKTKEDETD